MLEDYFNNEFQKDIERINFKELVCKNCSPKECRFNFDLDTVYFGDQEIIEVSKYINKNNYECFFISLFMIIIIDMGIYKYCRNNYYKKGYKIFRERTMYPKYGNIGFGFSFLPPKNIFSVLEKLNIININEINNYIEDFNHLFINKCKMFFEYINPNININDFIKFLLEDKDMIPEEKDIIFNIFVNGLKNEIK